MEVAKAALDISSEKGIDATTINNDFSKKEPIL
jgi:hypothetical protein